MLLLKDTSVRFAKDGPLPQEAGRDPVKLLNAASEAYSPQTNSCNNAAMLCTSTDMPTDNRHAPADAVSTA